MTTATPSPVNPIERLDVPLAQLQQDIAARTAPAPADPAVLIEVQQRLLADPNHSDGQVAANAGALYLVEHPECCSTLADYPDFARLFDTREDDAR